MNSKRKDIPVFRNEAEERGFWETHDSTEYLDWTQAQRAIFPNLTPGPLTPAAAPVPGAPRLRRGRCAG